MGAMDDFVLTISDDEAQIPDLDGAEQSEDASPPPQERAEKKRKREVNEKKSTKKQKNKKTQTPPTEENSDAENALESSAVYNDVDINPDFAFNLGQTEGNVVEGFEDAWNVPASGDQLNDSSKSLGVEDIIARRRQRAQAEKAGVSLPANAPVDGNEESQNEDESGDPNAHEDELLADDAFGMGAVEEDEDGSQEGEKSRDSDQSGAGSEWDEDDDAQSVGKESDDDSEAAPVPHPDDDIDGHISEDEEKREDPRRKARRDAFFAPEESAKDSKALAKTEASFQSMSLSRPILRGLTSLGFTSPTPIQKKTVPIALMGKDIVGGAVTGSGKTAAFVLPILERLLFRPKKVPTTRVSILTPTRELAVQCYNVAVKLAALTDITFALIVGGLSLREQEQTLKKRPDIVIATPGRFIDHMRNSASFVVENLEILVLDEADRMLEDGFADELNEVLNTIPRSRQTMLFSATMTDDVDQLIRVGLNKPVRLMVDAQKQTVSGLTQEFIKMKGPIIHPSKTATSTTDSSNNDNTVAEDPRRLSYLLHLCTTTYTAKTIIFLPTKTLAHRLKVLFALNGIAAAELHGSMSQEQRLRAITSFRDGSSTHLLATDLASRGLDIPRVETVINYTVPTTSTTYLHRVGRTARAGRAGVSCTLFTSSAPSKREGNKAKVTSERALLKPILKLAKAQNARIRTRTLPADAITALGQQIAEQAGEMEEVLKEEKEERVMAIAERDVVKGENLVLHEEEIKSRPRRTWFQSEGEKRAAKEVGREERTGMPEGGVAREAMRPGKRDRRRMSGKERKKEDDKRERGKSGIWKKGKKDKLAPPKPGKNGKGGAAAAAAGGKGKSGVGKSKTKPKKGRK
ncbi:MAG: nucleolar DEAD-box protein required for synthesis of 60S ribosomal subunit [Alyxoria varia]|nr:MAG: nucleolar DEAD-box protein required for synthesis of 60S ribosomal subunit [Alyxoria varia]